MRVLRFCDRDRVRKYASEKHRCQLSPNWELCPHVPKGVLICPQRLWFHILHCSFMVVQNLALDFKHG